MDHLVGLERPEFGKYMAKTNAPIYMSDISKQLLSTMPLYRHLVPYFKSVPIDQPFTLTIQSNDPVQAKKKEGAGKIPLKETHFFIYKILFVDIESLKNNLSSHTPNIGETIVVTCFGSGHCPGSIMVWIEGEHGNVLFTGDFRLYRGQAKRLTHLHRRRTDTDDDYLFKPIDNLYIDMTFFRPEILHIPTREVSCQALILWIKNLLTEKLNVNFHFKQR
jgi:mRNA degradation ribonuclease J1/J2